MAASDDGKALPVVDLAPFFVDVDDEGGVARGRATEAVREACMSSGFFRVVNHGVPRELMVRALELQALFFALPDEDKAKVRPAERICAPLPAGYARQPVQSVDRNEFLLVLHPRLLPNVYPAEHAGFREALVECHAKLTDLGLLIQEILGECMGLPRGFLGEYNNDRTFDFISARHGFPATKEDNIGTRVHHDVGCITFVLQDGVGGLEVLRPEGDWAPVEPVEGSIVVNIGDVVQVLSNDKFRSVKHRVYSLVFFFNVHGDKWVEPLPQFAADEAPRYRRFKYGEYLQLRGKKTHPPSRPEDIVDITHYAI